MCDTKTPFNKFDIERMIQYCAVHIIEPGAPAKWHFDRNAQTGSLGISLLRMPVKGYGLHGR